MGREIRGIEMTEEKKSFEDILEMLTDLNTEDSDRAYEMATLASNMIWMAREHIEAHASDFSKEMFKKWTDEFLPLALKSVGETDPEYLIPNISPKEFYEKTGLYPYDPETDAMNQYYADTDARVDDWIQEMTERGKL
jgi:hypothetical protein